MSMVGCYCAIGKDDLAELIRNPDAIDDFLANVPEDSYVYVDKEWEAIHFILNGSAKVGGEEPFASVVYGGTEFGPDHGYGPRRFHDQDAVASIARALSSVTPQVVEVRYRPDDMDEIYPDGEWSDPDSDFDLAGLQHQIEKLRKFYTAAASSGQCVMLWIG